MSKFLLQAAAAAVAAVSFSAIAQAPAPNTSAGGFQPIPRGCPPGKTARIVYDQKGAPVGMVCA